MEEESVITIYVPAGLKLNSANILKNRRTSGNVTTNGTKIDSKNGQDNFTPPKVIGKQQDAILRTESNNSYINESPKKTSPGITRYAFIKNLISKKELSPNTESISSSNCHDEVLPPKTIGANNFKKKPENNQILNSRTVCRNAVKDKPDTSNENRSKMSLKDKINETLKLRAKKSSNLASEKIEEASKSCKCTDCDQFLKCEIWRQKNISFNQTSLKKGLPLLKSAAVQKETTIKSISNHQFLLHSNFLLKPLFSLGETCFDKYVQTVLTTMNCSSPSPMQAHLWPVVQRGLSCMAIGAPQTGKTLTYLPAFCGFAMEKNDRYLELSQYDGPLIVILSPDKQQCLSIQSLISTLVANCEIIPVVEVLTEAPTPICSDIVIAVPSVLKECLKTGKISLKRLCHVAFENAHDLFKNFHQSLRNILNVMNEIQNERPHNKSIQIAVNSEKWTADLGSLLNELYMTPTVCFQDFLQAAIYSKVEFKKKKLKAEHKLFYLEDILATHYVTNKVVVFCSEDEIAGVTQHMMIAGVECITMTSELTEDEIFENENMWCSLKSGSSRVLLCTDDLFDKMKLVVKANWLVHFSPPSSWQQLQKRFRCLAENLYSPFNSEEVPRYCFFLMEEVSSSHIFNDFFEALTRSSIKYF